MKTKTAIAVLFATALSACASHEPPPPPPPPPPPFAHHEAVTVYFDYQKANLTATAADQVAGFLEQGHSAPHHVVVIGYCDTAEHHCKDLSVRRADAVKDELVRRGMDPAAIDTGGSDDLLVKTGDHVREPQNRRAVIDPR
ncbi:MAG: OmpA family protein [Rhizomicrobium sp.]